MVHLVYHCVVDILYRRTFIVVPAFGIGGVEIDNCTAVAVYANCLSPYSGCFVKPFAIVKYLECIKFTI